MTFDGLKALPIATEVEVTSLAGWKLAGKIAPYGRTDGPKTRERKVWVALPEGGAAAVFRETFRTAKTTSRGDPR